MEGKDTVKPDPDSRQARIAAKSKENQENRAKSQRGPTPFSFTTTTQQLPERGLVSAQSLAMIEYAEAVPEQGTDGNPRARGVGELGEKMEISINILDGKSFTLLMAPLATVAELKRKIEKNAQIEPEKQQILFAGKQLKDKYSMHDYGITNNCVIFCVPKENGDPAPQTRSRTLATPRRRRICPAPSLCCKCIC